MAGSRIFVCRVCGNIVMLVHKGGGPLSCCGQPMEELVANTTDAAQEKHVPVVTKEGNKVTVKVGSVPHPMTDQHYIEWIEIIGGDRICRKFLKPGKPAEAVFDGFAPEAVRLDVPVDVLVQDSARQIPPGLTGGIVHLTPGTVVLAGQPAIRAQQLAAQLVLGVSTSLTTSSQRAGSDHTERDDKRQAGRSERLPHGEELVGLIPALEQLIEAAAEDCRDRQQERVAGGRGTLVTQEEAHRDRAARS